MEMEVMHQAILVSTSSHKKLWAPERNKHMAADIKTNTRYADDETVVEDNLDHRVKIN